MPRTLNDGGRLLARYSGGAGFGECFGQLPNQDGERHIQRPIQGAGLWTGIVLEHFYRHGGIIDDHNARLNHAHSWDCYFADV